MLVLILLLVLKVSLDTSLVNPFIKSSLLLEAAYLIHYYLAVIIVFIIEGSAGSGVRSTGVISSILLAATDIEYQRVSHMITT